MLRQPSIMPNQKNFAAVPPREAYQRSVFDRTHGHKFTMQCDDLVPFFVDEVLPGDTHNVDTTFVARLSSALDYPIMDNLHFDTFYFYVPWRLVWDDFVRMMGEQDDPADTIDYEFPYISIPNPSGYAVGSLPDYMGIPPGVRDTGETKIMSLPFRAYNLIWNQWFRSELLQDSLPVPKGFTGDSSAYYLTCAKRGKRFDYFTSALTEPQKGDPVTFPVTAAATVEAYPLRDNMDMPLSTVFYYGNDNQEFSMYGNTSTPPRLVANADVGQPIDDAPNVSNDITFGSNSWFSISDNSNIMVDIPAGTAISVNDMRLAVAMQQYLELNARGGTRYVEFVESHFGVRVPDYRLQRPEFLGSSTQMININPVTMTNSSASPSLTSGLGQQAAYGTFSGRSGYGHSFLEHGVVIGLCNVRADLTYQQGIERFWLRRVREDIYDPIFANLGEQEIKNAEIFWQDDPVIDDDVFGYQERWAEYRYKPSRISGKFRSNPSSGTLDAYHLAEDFSALPELNDTFIQSAVPIDRVLAINSSTSGAALFVDTYIKFRCARLMPVYSVAGLKRL